MTTKIQKKVERKSFIIYKDSLNTAIKHLSLTERGQLITMISDFMTNGDVNTTKIDKPVIIAFGFIQDHLLRDSEKYYAIVERNRENGNKHKGKGKGKEPKKPTGLFGLPNKPIGNDNGNGNGIGNDTILLLPECLNELLKDTQWLSDSGATEKGMIAFNTHLWGQGISTKKLSDYKSHFYHWKNKNPELASPKPIRLK